MISTCPFCGRPLTRSESLIDDEVVIGCRPCAVFKIEGPTFDWIRGGGDVIDRLREQAGKFEETRNRDRDAMHSPITDPRWHRRELGESLRIDD